MSSTLSSYSTLSAYQANPVGNIVSSVFSEVASARSNYDALVARLDDENWRRNSFWLAVIVIALHVLVVVAYINRDTTPITQPVQHEVAIEFIKPEVTPPPAVEPPKPPPPQPKVQRVTPPQPAPALRTQPAEHNIAPSDITVAENTTAAKSSGPVAAASGPVVAEAAPTQASPAPPAPKVEEPITEANANAAYLNKPKPDYPPAALRQGWGGTVIMRVRVLASGQAESVTIKKSSGRKVLDDAASAAVLKWSFVPSKRGSTPIDGWATVPMIFNPDQAE